MGENSDSSTQGRPSPGPEADALATCSSSDGSKVAAASGLKKKKKKDGNVFGKSCIGKGTILFFRREGGGGGGVGGWG